jgi:vacuolar-type H+-ATPase subunit F/Vma7
MLKPKNKQELLKLLQQKTFDILLIEEGDIKKIIEQLKVLRQRNASVIVIT